MDFQKVLGAVALKVDEQTGKIVGLEYVGQNDPRVQAALQQVRNLPNGQGNFIEGAPDELKNVAVVAVQE